MNKRIEIAPDVLEKLKTMFAAGDSYAKMAKEVGYKSPGALRFAMKDHGMDHSDRVSAGIASKTNNNNPRPNTTTIMKGRVLSDAAKAAISAGMKRRHAERRAEAALKEPLRTTTSLPTPLGEIAKFSYPSWYEEARTDREAGMSMDDLSEKYKVTKSRISQVTGKGWMERIVSERRPLHVRNAEVAANRELKKEIIMADRKFDKFFPKDPSDRRHAVIIRCGTCNNYTTFKKHGIINPVHAAKTFREKGWSIGAGPRADRCPDCVKRMGSHAPTPVPVKEFPVLQTPAQIVKSVEQTLGIAPEQRKPAAFPVAAAEPTPSYINPDDMKKPDTPLPVEALAPMSRMDRRTIFTKLNDVYLDEATGYRTGWNDASVALDLGTPIQWVAEVREADFGPAVDPNRERLLKMTALRADITEAISAWSVKLPAIEKLIEDYDAATDRVEKLFTEFKAISAQLSS